ncbi:DUF4328 domain-containing protein [Streptomyces sp. NBC_00354]|uniref:DUF4328 domain-containing protein n=1 Tax=Streptomyces sp. NBC_00354 TaxID=2975723 RepID=UPI002E25FBE9|nr:DUF4328 domain-containing protein [Streptomyces sp. NBC_01001]
MSFGTRSLPPLGAPPVRSLLRSPKGLATALTVLLGVCAATRTLMLAAGLNRYEALGGAVDPEPSWRLFSMAMGLALLVMVPTAVVFIVWFHRVRVNAGVFAPEVFRRGAGWAIGIWFIPFVGWTVLAHGIATRMWTASAPKPPRGVGASVSPVPVTAWSGAFGAAMLLSLASNRIGDKALTEAGLRDAVLVGMASDLVYAVAAGLAVVFVRRLSAMQSRA